MCIMCIISSWQCRYEISAEHLEAAVRAVQTNCQGCALKVIGNGTAALSKTLTIGGSYGELDLVILGQPWRGASSEPTTLWDLNLNHITITTNSGIDTRICFSDLMMTNGLGSRGCNKGSGGAVQIISHNQGMTVVSMYNSMLTENMAEVLQCNRFFSHPYKAHS